MKKYLVLVAVVCLPLIASAQPVDVQAINPADIDFSRVDLANVEFFFQGPFFQERDKHLSQIVWEGCFQKCDRVIHAPAVARVERFEDDTHVLRELGIT